MACLDAETNATSTGRGFLNATSSTGGLIGLSTREYMDRKERSIPGQWVSSKNFPGRFVYKYGTPEEREEYWKTKWHIHPLNRPLMDLTEDDKSFSSWKKGAFNIREFVEQMDAVYDHIKDGKLPSEPAPEKFLMQKMTSKRGTQFEIQVPYSSWYTEEKKDENALMTESFSMYSYSKRTHYKFTYGNFEAALKITSHIWRPYTRVGLKGREVWNRIYSICFAFLASLHQELNGQAKFIEETKKNWERAVEEAQKILTPPVEVMKEFAEKIRSSKPTEVSTSVKRSRPASTPVSVIKHTSQLASLPVEQPLPLALPPVKSVIVEEPELALPPVLETKVKTGSILIDFFLPSPKLTTPARKYPIERAVYMAQLATIEFEHLEDEEEEVQQFPPVQDRKQVKRKHGFISPPESQLISEQQMAIRRCLRSMQKSYLVRRPARRPVEALPLETEEDVLRGVAESAELPIRAAAVDPEDDPDDEYWETITRENFREYNDYWMVKQFGEICSWVSYDEWWWSEINVLDRECQEAWQLEEEYIWDSFITDLYYPETMTFPTDYVAPWNDTSFGGGEVLTGGHSEMEETVIEENVTFEDERDVQHEQGILEGQVHARAEKIAMQENSWELSPIFKKPILVTRLKWSVEDIADKQIWRGYIPGDVTLGIHERLLEGFEFFRGHPQIRVQFNSTKFHFGRLCVVWFPGAKDDSISSQYPIDNWFSFPRAILDASLSNSVTLDIPFAHPTSYFRTSTDSQDRILGYLSIFVMNKLGVATAASKNLEGSLWISWSDVELHQARTHYPVTWPRFIAKAEAATVIGSAVGPAVKDAVQTAVNVSPFSFKNIATKIGNVIGSTQNADKPTYPGELPRFVQNTVTSLNFGDGLDMSTKLSLDPKASTGSDVSLISATSDDMDLKNLLQIPTRLATFSLTTSDESQKEIAKIFVMPNSYRTATSKLYFKDYPEDWFSQLDVPLLGYTARNFKFYRGGLVYTIQVVASLMHSARLAVTFSPYIRKDVSFDEAMMNNVEIIDVQEKKETTITCPYMSSRPWLRCDKLVHISDMNQYSMLGVLQIWVLNRLVAPDTASQTIDINVFVAAAPDFELSFITDMTSFLDPLCLMPNIADKPVPEAGQEFITTRSQQAPTHQITRGENRLQPITATTMGESFMDLKTLLRRYYPVYDFYSELGKGQQQYICIPNTPCLAGNGAINPKGCVSTMSPLYRFSQIFTFWRGSLRYKFVFTNQSTVNGTMIKIVHVPQVFPFQFGWNPTKQDKEWLEHIEAHGTILAITTRQASLEVEVPFYTPFTQLFTSPAGADDLAATGSLIAVFYGDTTIHTKVYQSAGDSFQLNYFRGAPYMWNWKNRELERDISGDSQIASDFKSTVFKVGKSLGDPLPYPPDPPGKSWIEEAEEEEELKPEGYWEDLKNVILIPGKISKALDKVEKIPDDPISKIFEMLLPHIQEVTSCSFSVVDWTVTIARLVTGFNSYIQTTSILVKVAAIITIVSELLGKAIENVKSSFYTIVTKIVSSMNGCEQGNLQPEAQVLDFVAPLLASLGVGGLLVGFQQLPSDKETADLIRSCNDRLRLFNGGSLAMSNFKNLYKEMKELVDNIVVWIVEKIDPVEAARMKMDRNWVDIEKWIQTVDEVEKKNYLEAANRNPFVKMEYLGLGVQAKMLQSQLIQGKLGKEASLVREYIRKAQVIANNTEKSHLALPFRIDPFHIQWFGEPGVGKSTNILPTIMAVMDHLGRPQEDRICPINITDEFFNGFYKQQAGIYMDDLGAMNSEEQWKHYFNLKSNVAFPLNMAFEKSTPFSSQFLSSTTNDPYPQPNFMNNTLAVWRRRNVLIEVVKRPPAGVAFDVTNEDHRRYRFFNPENRREMLYGGQYLTYAQMIERCKQISVEYFRVQQEILGNLLASCGYPQEGVQTWTVDDAKEFMKAQMAHDETYEFPRTATSNEIILRPAARDAALALPPAIRGAAEAEEEPIEGDIVALEEGDLACFSGDFDDVELRFDWDTGELRFLLPNGGPDPDGARKIGTMREFCHRMGWDFMQKIKACTPRNITNALKEALGKIRNTISNCWQSVKEKYPSLGVLTSWPAKIAAGLVVIGGLIGLTARVVHSCVCATLRGLGYRCVKCGRWPKLEDCQNKPWLLEEWKKMYGTREYESIVTSLEEENSLQQAQGRDLRLRPTLGTAEAYEVGTKGMPKISTFAEQYSQNTNGGIRISTFAESSSQNIEDLVNHRLTQATYRLQAYGAGVRTTMNAVAIGGRYIITTHHFMEIVRQITKSFDIYHGNAWMNILWEESRQRKIPNKDLVIYEMPVQFHQHKDLTPHFISEKDISKITRTRGFLLKRHDEKTIHVHELENITALSRIEYDHNPTGLEPTYYHVQNAYAYPMGASPGCCGSLLCTTSNRVEGKILGFHVAGTGTRGMSQLITKEMLAPYVKDQRGFPVPPTIAPITKALPEGHFSLIGKVPPSKGIFTPKKTSIIPTEIAGALTVPVTLPSVLSANDPRLEIAINPMKLAIEKYGNCPKQFHPQHVEMVTRHLKSIIERWTVQRKPEVLSTQEAIQGLPDYEGFERLPRNTSPGYPYVLTRPKGESGKDYMFSEDGQIVNDELKDNLAYREKMAAEGQRVLSIWECCLKDERRPIAKVKSGSTRLFTIPPTDFSILMRKFTLDFTQAMKDNRKDSFAKIGINTQSLEWTELWQYMREFSDICFAGDFKQFDGTEPPDLLYKIGDLIIFFFECNGSPLTESQINTVRVLIEEGIHTMLIDGRNIFINHTGNQSGCPLTTVRNCFIVFYYLALAWLDITLQVAPEYSTMAAFERNVRIADFGDDHIAVIKRNVKEFYNQDTVAKFLDRYGITVTNAEKNGITKYMPLEDATFLKNSFARHETISGIMVPLMAKDTIFELLNWTREAPDQLQLLEDNCNDALRFMYFYGFEAFTNLRVAIVIALKERNITLKILTYDDFHFWFLFTIGKLPKLSLAEGFFEQVASHGNGPLARMIMKTLQMVPYKLLSLTGAIASERTRTETDDRYAIAIPSGEGKSWLCNHYPKIFVDHDELLLPAARQKLKHNGLSLTALLTIFELDFPSSDRRILLCHHPDNTKRKILESYVLPKPCYIRANAYGRARLKNPRRLDRETRNKEILELVNEHEPNLYKLQFSP